MKKAAITTTVTIALFLIIWVMGYFMIGFIENSYNAQSWEKDSRLGLVAIFGVLLCFSPLIWKAIYKEIL